jgi:TRAF-interacting protein
LSFQASVLRGECKRIEAFKRENDEIQAKLDLMTTVESLLTSTTSDVEEILAKDVDRKSLAVTVASLRRELKASDYRKNELRKVLQANQNDLRGEIARRRKMEEQLSVADSENYRLKNEVEKMENDILLHVCHSEETDSEKSSNESSLLNRNIMKRSYDKSTDSPSIVSTF